MSNINSLSGCPKLFDNLKMKAWWLTGNGRRCQRGLRGGLRAFAAVALYSNKRPRHTYMRGYVDENLKTTLTYSINNN